MLILFVWQFLSFRRPTHLGQGELKGLQCICSGLGRLYNDRQQKMLKTAAGLAGLVFEWRSTLKINRSFLAQYWGQNMYSRHTRPQAQRDRGDKGRKALVLSCNNKKINKVFFCFNFAEIPTSSPALFFPPVTAFSLLFKW